jgi:poly(3-hydroxybutyrate) depolymerase
MRQADSVNPSRAREATTPGRLAAPQRRTIQDVAATKVLTIHYRAHDGQTRPAYLLLPGDVGPDHAPALPLVVSPHGRGVDALTNTHLWGDLPGQWGFAVINPEGQGRKLELYSWGYRRQIDDLVRMPAIVRETLPWFRIVRDRVYAVGGSMGGQETLLLVARRPDWLAGAAAFDSPTDMARRYHDFPLIPNGAALQELAREEVGGTPETNPVGYALRSPLAWARKIAFSWKPLQIWWSTQDQIVVDQAAQSGALYERIKQLNPKAPVSSVVGTWLHSQEMTAATRLPEALAALGLRPPV